MKQGVARRSLLVRGARLVVGTVALSLPGFARGMSVAEAAGPTSQQTYASRAVTCYNAMQQYFFVTDGTSLYRETYPWSAGSNTYCYLWPFTRALVGTLALAGSRAHWSLDPTMLPRHRTGSRRWRSTGTQPPIRPHTIRTSSRKAAATSTTMTMPGSAWDSFSNIAWA